MELNYLANFYTIGYFVIILCLINPNAVSSNIHYITREAITISNIYNYNQQQLSKLRTNERNVASGISRSQSADPNLSTQSRTPTHPLILAGRIFHLLKHSGLLPLSQADTGDIMSTRNIPINNNRKELEDQDMERSQVLLENDG